MFVRACAAILLAVSLSACSFPTKQVDVLWPAYVMFTSEYGEEIKIEAFNDPYTFEGHLRVAITREGAKQEKEVNWDLRVADGFYLRPTGHAWLSSEWSATSYDSQVVGEPKKLTVSTGESLELFFLRNNNNGSADVRVVTRHQDQTYTIESNDSLKISGLIITNPTEGSDLNLQFNEDWRLGPAQWRND